MIPVSLSVLATSSYKIVDVPTCASISIVTSDTILNRANVSLKPLWVVNNVSAVDPNPVGYYYSSAVSISKAGAFIMIVLLNLF